MNELKTAINDAKVAVDKAAHASKDIRLEQIALDQAVAALIKEASEMFSKQFEP